MNNVTKTYDVIWIDDQWEDYKTAIEKAKTYHVNVVAFKSVDDAWGLLQHTLERWDAVLLDTSCFIECDDTTADIDALFEAINRLNELKSQREIPYFVYTSDTQFIENKTLRKALVDTEVYIKGNYDSERKLIIDIKRRADEQIGNLVKNKYSRILSQMRIDVHQKLIPILINFEKERYSQSNDMNSIRKILEKVFEELEELGLINEDSYNQDPYDDDKVTLNDKCYALNKVNKRICPNYIVSFFMALVRVCNGCSHNLPLEKMVSSGKRQYIHGASTMQLLTILEWLLELRSTIGKNHK